jgi:aryl-alcohol dehydrogenase-like predicted oxidoreductase
MRKHPLGRTGLFVSELCLGTMTFGSAEGMWSGIAGLNQVDAERLVGQAVDAGVNFIDTADVYSGGLSEEITGRALRNLKLARDEVIVATKVFGETGKGPNSRGASRHHIMDGIKASLGRLQLDYVDLYQIHGFDPATPIEETVRALDQLVRDGHVRYVGVSNWAAWQIATALGIAERLGLARFESLQAYYSVAGRDLERELLPLLGHAGMGLMVWSPLAGGLLSGKYATEAQAGGQGRRSGFDFPPVDKGRATRCIDVMRTVAKAHDVSIATVAIAWVLHQPQVTSVILGAKHPEQLAENLKSVELKLQPEELGQISAVSALPPEYPGWMLDFQGRTRRQQLQESGDRS